MENLGPLLRMPNLYRLTLQAMAPAALPGLETVVRCKASQAAVIREQFGGAPPFEVK